MASVHSIAQTSYRRGGELTEGRATYSDFRKFNVDVSTIIK